MRLGDLDALSAFVGDLRSTLHKEQAEFNAMTQSEFEIKDSMLLSFQYAIDNAPTVEQKYIEARSQGEWIPASERLPDDMQRVLIWFEYYRYGDFNCMYQTYGFGYVCDGKWSPFINGETGWQDYNIIAWQPLPEPYEKGGAE